MGDMDLQFITRELFENRVFCHLQDYKSSSEKLDQIKLWKHRFGIARWVNPDWADLRIKWLAGIQIEIKSLAGTQ